MHAGDRNDGENDQRERPKACEQSHEEADGPKELEPRGQEPADVDRDHIERKNKVILKIAEPVIAIKFLQASIAVFVRHEEANQHQAGTVFASAVQPVCSALVM